MLDFGVAILGDLVLEQQPVATGRGEIPEGLEDTAQGLDDLLGTSTGLDVSRVIRTTGLAAAAGPDDGRGLRSRCFIGTPAYMAPEQWRGEATGPAADLFAMGVMLYELMAGKRPFAGSSAAELQVAMLGPGPAPNLESSVADLPRSLGDLVARLLAKDPSDRPTGAGQVLEALAHLDDGDARPLLEVSDRPLSVTELVAGWELLHPPIVGASSLDSQDIDGQAMKESLEYFRDQGGDVQALVGRLNDKIAVRSEHRDFFKLSAEVLTAGDYAFSHETYFLVTMLMKVLTGDDGFRYRSPDGKPLSVHHKLYECAPLTVPELFGERAPGRASARNFGTAVNLLTEVAGENLSRSDDAKGVLAGDEAGLKRKYFQAMNALIKSPDSPLRQSTIFSDELWVSLEVTTLTWEICKAIAGRGDFIKYVGRKNYTRSMMLAAKFLSVNNAFRTVTNFANQYTTLRRYSFSSMGRGTSIVNSMVAPGVYSDHPDFLSSFSENACGIGRNTMENIPNALYGLEHVESIETHCCAGHSIPPEHARLAVPLSKTELDECDGQYCQYLFRWHSALTGWQRLAHPVSLSVAAAAPALYLALSSPDSLAVQALAVAQACTLPVLVGLAQRSKRLTRQHREVAEHLRSQQALVEEERCKLARAEAELRSRAGSSHAS
ncbi:MAG: protein kinase [Pseudomonadota bacterium]